ncbi:hypothetical protein GFY24_17255 [Nocardia sp. SYP-A9097]|uniref:hypothetical protein n=1 Tax=Nocardia sp. SYP-A9097 TaxID=2663237 RepID=UPI00129BA335|nr:hypothetical protein [Nocardia sp. SYP-A9097]MRH89177.1 hypothetical protein [Nocardia sp. SYP-A9097]
MNIRRCCRVLAGVSAVLLGAALIFGAGPGSAEGGVRTNVTIEGRAISGADARNPVRLDPGKVSQVVVEVVNGTAKPVTVRRVDLAGHVLGLNFFSYSTSVELTVAAGKSDKLTYRLDPAGLDGQATGLIGADLTLIGADGKPLTSAHTVVDVRGSLLSVYGLFGIILAVLTALAIADAALTVAGHRLSVNRWQRGLRLLAPGLGLGLMIGFTASVGRWWVPGTPLWLALAGVTATLFFLAGYLSPTPRPPSDLNLDAEDLAAARELDAHGYAAATSDQAPPIPYQPFIPQPSMAPGPSGYRPPVLPEPVRFNPGRTPSRPMPIVGGPGPQHPRSTTPPPGGTPILSPDELEILGYPVGGADETIGREAVDRKPVPAGGTDETIARDPVVRKPVPAGEDEPTIRDTPGEWRFRPGGAGR